MEDSRAAYAELAATINNSRKLIRESQTHVWNWLLSWFYNRLPTEQGELDDELKNHIEMGLLHVGARFKAFNRVIGTLLKNAIVLTFILFISAFILVGFLILASDIIPEIAFQLLALAFGFVLVMAAAYAFLANIIILLYFGSVFWYGFQQMRANLTTGDEDRSATYECRSHGDVIKVYEASFASVVRAFTYGLILGLIIVSLIVWPWILDTLGWLATFIPIQKVSQTPFISMVDSAVAGVSALLPIDFSFFFNPRGFQSLVILVVVFLVFSIFLNGKGIIQHAKQSQFDWSDIESFTANEERDRCYQIIKIALYHLIHGELTTEFRDIRGEIIKAVVLFGFTISLSMFYISVFLDAM